MKPNLPAFFVVTFCMSRQPWCPQKSKQLARAEPSAHQCSPLSPCPACRALTRQSAHQYNGFKAIKGFPNWKCRRCYSS